MLAKSVFQKLSKEIKRGIMKRYFVIKNNIGGLNLMIEFNQLKC
jgi:hypothetical protein